MSFDRTSENASYPPISDYALIGDCRSAGLVSRDGSLDWLCLPRFDSPSVFAALLDASEGGRFCVRPVGEYSSERRYLANTNVLETVFRTPTGACVLCDLMSVSSEEDKRAHLTPEHEVLRELEGLEGEVEVEIFYDPRPDYGRVRPLLEERGALGLRCEGDGTSLTLRSEIPLELIDSDRSAGGFARIRSGERKYLSLTYSMEAPAVVPLLGEAARGRIERTVRWWQEWANRCTYEGPYRDAVVRSALALKLMTYAPSGALVAAPTTSLPETIGGGLHWLAAARHTPYLARAPRALRRVRRGEAARTGVGASRRLRGVSPGADRQRRPGPAPALCLWGGHQRRRPVLGPGRALRPRHEPDARRSGPHGMQALARTG